MKKVKFILPAMAFFFAILASLATVNAKSTLALKDVSLPGVDECEKIGQCQTTGATSLCKQPSAPTVYLKEYFSDTETCGNTFNGIWQTP